LLSDDNGLTPMMVETKSTEDTPVHPVDEMTPNICLVVSDSLRWDVFVSANPTNILSLGRAKKVHSIACSTHPSMMAYMMNYPPIGVGLGLFHQGYWRTKGPAGFVATGKEGQTYRAHSPIRQWMPRYYQEKGYKTAFLTGNAVPWRVEQQTKGVYSRFFDYMPIDYLVEDISTPSIIRDLDKYVKKNKEEPILSVNLLLDTHSPYHDGNGNIHLIDPRQPDINYHHQELAMKFVDNVFPNFINIFKQTDRPTHFIFTSDHGENFSGAGWGHNSFREKLTWGGPLFEIPSVRGYITHWGKVDVSGG